jgi:hypothetical protein
VGTDKPKPTEPLPVGSHRYHVPGRQTTVVSAAFRLRRVSDFVVIENVVPKLMNGEELKAVWEAAVSKEDCKGVILHFPSPTYVSSVVIVTLREIGRQMQEAGRPWRAVLHPKLRLLLEIFELKDVIPTEDRLENAVKRMRELMGLPAEG